MKIFLSWSGERSRAVAEAFSAWIIQVIPAVDPWMLSAAERGVRWSHELSSQLEQSKVGIVCLTRENLLENWLHFEIGALSRTRDATICAFLLDVPSADVAPLFGQLQPTQWKKEEVRFLLHVINQAVYSSGEGSLAEGVLEETFENNWPHLVRELEKISARAPSTPFGHRSDRSLLEEILERVRNQERRINSLEAGQGQPIPQREVKTSLPTDTVLRLLQGDFADPLPLLNQLAFANHERQRHAPNPRRSLRLVKGFREEDAPVRGMGKAGDVRGMD